MKKITDIFKEKGQTLSFEFFPPRTDKGRENLMRTAGELAGMSDFFSVTYGAGGSSSKSTFDIVVDIQKQYGVPAMHHFTCVTQTYDAVRSRLNELKQADIRNIMALRGDPPVGMEGYSPGPENPKYGYELIELIREHEDYFAVGVPGFPEGHPNTPTLELDSRYLKIKQDKGADFVITQLFFENERYFEFRERAVSAGVTMRLIPGIFIITNYDSLVDFCRRCELGIPKIIVDTFEPLRDNHQATLDKGLEFAIAQCRSLLDNGAPGLHMYCLNKTEPSVTVLKNIGF